MLIDHCTVACLVAWPLNENEAGGDLVLIETWLLFMAAVGMRETKLLPRLKFPVFAYVFSRPSSKQSQKQKRLMNIKTHSTF